MKKSDRIITKVALAAVIILLTGFGGAKSRKFDIRFNLNDIQTFVPSTQIAIWLETTDNSYIRTLYLTEYLSYGGYNIAEICNGWSSKTKWDEVTKEEFDAVTSATPGVGNVKLKLECPASLVPEGKYLIFIEVHLVDEYNELHSGELTISGKKSAANLTAMYKPGKYPKMTEGDILSNVQVVVK